MSITNQLSDQLLLLQNEEQIKRIITEQKKCLLIHTQSQQTIDSLNKFSKARYEDIHTHFESHSRLLKDIRKDLESVFSKLKKIKQELAIKYPSEMEVVHLKYPPPQIEDD
ncbi:hypothetical protein BDB01DRAFT_803474 [Pilobolus umbonatus]|nr:hypothetical protein BDB01DRAFT_803474 [Pilobolus umbonatus]